MQNYTAFYVNNVDFGLRSVSGAKMIIPDPDRAFYFIYNLMAPRVIHNS
jgi:hypothetical protein